MQTTIAVKLVNSNVSYFPVVTFFYQGNNEASWLFRQYSWEIPMRLLEISRRLYCPFWISINGVAFAKYGDS